MADYEKVTPLLEDLRLQLLEAQVSFDIWLALLPTEENNILESFNMFVGFFKPTRAAHVDRIFITDPCTES